MTRILFVATAMLSLTTACFEANPCDDYVEYMCDCHGDDPDFDCAELQRIYASADPSVQDQCAVELTQQQDADDDAGLVCDLGGGADTGAADGDSGAAR